MRRRLRRWHGLVGCGILASIFFYLFARSSGGDNESSSVSVLVAHAFSVPGTPPRKNFAGHLGRPARVPEAVNVLAARATPEPRPPASPQPTDAAALSESGNAQPVSGLAHSKVLICGFYVAMSASGPVIFDWIKANHGGRIPIAVPALTFWAYMFAILMCLSLVARQGRKGFRMLNRPGMLWRFCITTCFFTLGDILSFTSIQHLDVATYSLVGKAFSIVLIVLLSRLILNKRQTSLQYSLVFAAAASCVVFCHGEAMSRPWASRVANPDSMWFLGLAQRILAALCLSLAVVLQERLFKRNPTTPFHVQQVWMGVGAVGTSLFVLRVIHNMPLSALIKGLEHWRVWVLLTMYTSNGLLTGLIVKRLGAINKALCVPIYLGLCYAYAVSTKSAALSFQVVGSWLATSFLILLYTVSKASSSGTRLRNR